MAQSHLHQPDKSLAEGWPLGKAQTAAGNAGAGILPVRAPVRYSGLMINDGLKASESPKHWKDSAGFAERERINTKGIFLFLIISEDSHCQLQV